MPLFFWAGEPFYQGSVEKFNTISTYASLYACLARGLVYRLQGDPLVFFPTTEHYDIIRQFLLDFAFYFKVFIYLLE